MMELRQPLPTVVVCGFLGAGKTTFLRQRLQDEGPGTVVLVNDFGELGMDSAAIRAAGGLDGLHVVEITGGCICCSVGLSMPDAILQLIRDHRPTQLFIEPSGVAEASQLIGLLRTGPLREMIRLDSVITVVDAETLLEYSEPETFGTFFSDQITSADAIVINKRDLVTPATLTEVLANLSSLNPSAILIPATHGKIEASLPEPLEPLTPAKSRPNSRKTLGPVRSPAWEYFGMAATRTFSTEELENLGHRLTSGECGTLMRAKGVLAGRDGNRLEIQLVGERVTVSETPPDISCRFSCIGLHLDRNRLTSCFAAEEGGTYGESHGCL